MKAKVEATGKCYISDEGNLSSNINLNIKKENKNIDWEQRRYEIAKDIMNGVFSNPIDFTMDEKIIAIRVLNFTDALIKELKKK